MTDNYDPYAAASNPQIRANGIFGQAHVFCEPVVLVKGTGKVAFKADQHKVEDRRTNIAITIDVMPGSSQRFPTHREMLAESAEWAKTVWPSLKALGLTSVRDLDGAWVKAELVPVGRQYTDRNGAVKEATTLKFVAVFRDQAACVAAYGGGNGNASAPDASDDGPMPWGNAEQPAPATNPEKATALEFVKVLVAQSKGDRAKLAQDIAAMPLINKYFTISSPEVQALLA